MCDLCVWQDSVMPSQEPRLDDKNDEADLPSEDTDGSEYFGTLESLLPSFFPPPVYKSGKIWSTVQ